MATRMSVGAVVAGLGFVLAAALASGVTAARGQDPNAPRNGAVAWAGHLGAMDAALRTGDMTVAHEHWREAYAAALGSRRWEGLAETGDAALRLGRATGAADGGVPRARALYLAALFRARDAGSVDGVLRVATSFKALGDRDVSQEAVRMADRLTASRATTAQRAQVAAVPADRPPTIPADI